MVVVVVVPHGDGVAALLLRVVGAGVEALLGQDAVVALDLAVVSWGVGADSLVAGGQGGDCCGEGPGPVVRSVVGDDPHEPGDAVGGEEGPGTAEEADRGGGLLVVEGLGVSQAGEAVDGGVQVGVADPGSFASFGGFGFGVPRPWALQPPPGGMRPTFLTSRWIMWPGKRATMGLLTRLVCPVGSMSPRRFRSALSSHRVTDAYRHHRSTHSQLVADAAGGTTCGCGASAR